MQLRQGATHWAERAVLLVVLILVAACSTTPTPSNADRDEAPPIASESPEVQQAFERAHRLLVDGDWDQAVEEFRLLQGQYSRDDTAALAELYIARGLLGDVDRRFTSAHDDDDTIEPVDREVYALLEPLAEAGGVDSRIRYGAQAYLAVAHALDAEVPTALDVVSDYPGASIGAPILEGDHRWIWPLLGEGFTQAGRHDQAVVAWGELHALLRREAAEEQLESQKGEAQFDREQDRQRWFADLELAPQADLATTRAFDAVEHLSENDVHTFLGHERFLVRAVGVWTYIRRALDDSPGDEKISTLQEVFNELSSDFLTIGAADRASELSSSLAGVSGPERLVIGALVPLSGPNRAVGYRALAGMLVAQRSFHAAGEPSITLIIEDSHGDVAQAYERLVAEDAIAVVGPLETGEARQLVDVATEVGVPFVALTADRVVPLKSGEADGVEEEGRDDESVAADDEELESVDEVRAPVAFRNFVDSIAEARAAAHLAFEHFGDRRAAVVFPDMGYGRALSTAFSAEFRRRGGQIVAEVEYDADGSNYVDEARRVSQAEPEAIFLPDRGSKIAEISAFFAQENIWGMTPGNTRPRDDRIWVHYLGTSLWQNPVLLHQAGNYVEGAVVPAWYSPLFSEPESRQFTRGFEAIYGSSADPFVAFAYDSVDGLRSLVVDRGITDAAGVVDALFEGDWRVGATGRYGFDAVGEPRRQLRYLTVEDGQWSIFPETIETPMEGRLQVEEQLDAEQLEGLEEDAHDDPDSVPVDEP